jgi:hypothetical protein
MLNPIDYKIVALIISRLASLLKLPTKGKITLLPLARHPTLEIKNPHFITHQTYRDDFLQNLYDHSKIETVHKCAVKTWPEFNNWVDDGSLDRELIGIRHAQFTSEVQLCNLGNANAVLLEARIVSCSATDYAELSLPCTIFGGSQCLTPWDKCNIEFNLSITAKDHDPRTAHNLLHNIAKCVDIVIEIIYIDGGRGKAIKRTETANFSFKADVSQYALFTLDELDGIEKRTNSVTRAILDHYRASLPKPTTKTCPPRPLLPAEEIIRDASTYARRNLGAFRIISMDDGNSVMFDPTDNFTPGFILQKNGPDRVLCICSLDEFQLEQGLSTLDFVQDLDQLSNINPFHYSRGFFCNIEHTQDIYDLIDSVETRMAAHRT